MMKIQQWAVKLLFSLFFVQLIHSSSETGDLGLTYDFDQSVEPDIRRGVIIEPKHAAAQKPAEAVQKDAERAQKDAERAQKDTERAQKGTEPAHKATESAQKGSEVNNTELGVNKDIGPINTDPRRSKRLSKKFFRPFGNTKNGRIKVANFRHFPSLFKGV